MNILHHKSWHVRKKDNIAKVRKDEAEALDKELQKQQRHTQYKSETRLKALRANANKVGFVEGETNISYPEDEHINFFETYEKGEQVESFVNEEKEAEKKQEIENWEKKMGILSYLGDSAVDSQKCTPWYMQTRKKAKEKVSTKKNNDYFKENQEMDNIFSASKLKKMEEDRLKEVIENEDRKRKEISDPNLLRLKKLPKYIQDVAEKINSSSDAKVKKLAPSAIERLRAERLKREAQERVKAEKAIKDHTFTSSNSVKLTNREYGWVEK